LAIDEKALGPDSRRVAFDLNNLAANRETAGDYDEAEPLYRRALAIDEKSLGQDSPETKVIRKNLERLQKSEAKDKTQ